MGKSDLLTMGKNNKIKKYYAHEDGKSQLRSVKAKSDEEAFEKFKQIFGHDKFAFGNLPHAAPNIPWKITRGVMKDIMGEDFAKVADNLHSVGAV